jgi:RNA polymerase sigma-70 factor (ECF subfamily)
MSTFLNVTVPQDCLRRAGDGDPGAQRQLYEAFARPVYTLLRRLVLRPAIAEELLHDTFIEVLGHLAGYQGSGSFAGWVRMIAVRKALAHLRSPWHGRLSSEPLDVLVADPVASRTHDAQDELERALNALPPVARSVVWLHDVEGYTHAEIGALHAQSASFSKSQLARAHATLRELLEPSAGATPCKLASTT